MQISLIIPTFQASRFINVSVEKIVNYLESTDLEYEVIFIDDCSSDDTLGNLNLYSNNPKLKILSNDRNEGKFSAIAKGMAVAQGDVLVFTDADLPYDLEVIFTSYKIIKSRTASIVVGDRRHVDSVAEISVPFARKIFSFTLSVIVKLLITGKMIDSQCGFKAFDGPLAKEIFQLLKCRRFAGDIEILYIAMKHKLSIERIPVRFVNNHSSTVKEFTDFLEFIKCITMLKINWNRKLYTSSKLRMFLES